MTIVTQDLVDEFFNTGFEEEAVIPTHAPQGEPQSKTILVHFTNNYQKRDAEGYLIESNQPAIECKSIDVENVKQNDLIIVRGKGYRVSERQKDEDGFTNILLKY